MPICAGTPSFFSNHSLSRATSGSTVSLHSEAVPFAEDTGHPAKGLPGFMAGM